MRLPSSLACSLRPLSIQNVFFHRRKCSSIKLQMFHVAHWSSSMLGHGFKPSSSSTTNNGSLQEEGSLIGSLMLDYDSTITQESTVPLQLDTITNDAFKHDAESIKESRRTLIAQITRELRTEYNDICNRLLINQRSSSAFNIDEVHRISKEMDAFESKWTTFVERAHVLKGIDEETFLNAAKETRMQPGVLFQLETVAKNGIRIEIVSANWSQIAGVFIQLSAIACLESRYALEEPTPKIRVHANELEYRQNKSTGRIVRKIISGKDKVIHMKYLLQNDVKRPVVFVGDSLLDLESLLLADIGVVIGNDPVLRALLRNLKITIGEISRHNLKNVLGQKSTALNGGRLYAADNWNEISRFLSVNRGHETTPRVLIIAGSDSGGGAGIQADLKTCMATGSFGTTAITAITSQNTFGVQKILPTPIPHLVSQINSILTDIGADAVKIGMVPSIEMVEAIAVTLRKCGRVSLVVDPVLISTSGHELSSQSVGSAIVERLFPLATVVCPNVPEAIVLSGKEIQSISDLKQVAQFLLKTGPQVVVLKGGHLISDDGMVHDVISSSEGTHVMSHPQILTRRLHGTGCTLASAIASIIAQGWQPSESIQMAIQYVRQALKASVSMDLGNGTQLPFNHGYRWYKWPQRLSLRSCLDLRVYAITDHSCNARHGRSITEAVKQAIVGGATMIQVREKTSDGGDFYKAVETVLEVANPQSIPVIVNDRVDVAIAANADGVHIGQEDLPVDVVRCMIGPDKILGVSAKTKEDVTNAWQSGADYVGVGAIFATSSKRSSVIGLKRLKEICESSPIPVVAIGGIDSDNVAEVIVEGAKGVAVISAIFDSTDVRSSTEEIRKAVDASRLGPQ